LADKISGDPAQVKLSKQQGRALGVAWRRRMKKRIHPCMVGGLHIIVAMHLTMQKKGLHIVRFPCWLLVWSLVWWRGRFLVTDENEWEIKSVLAFAFEGEVDPFMHPVLSRGHQVKETRCKRHVTAAAKCQPKKKKHFILSISLHKSTPFFLISLHNSTPFYLCR
jgi:hypothetical protein